MPELQRLRADHASAVLAFELANRTYFAAWISDRGDEYYEQFAELHHVLLAEQQAGVGAYNVLVGEDGLVLSRFNLVFVEIGRQSSVTESRNMRPDEVWPPRRSVSSAIRQRPTTASEEFVLLALRRTLRPRRY